jgi:hypothetical protein
MSSQDRVAVSHRRNRRRGIKTLGKLDH